MNTILAKKMHMTTRFDAQGNRVPVTLILAHANTVLATRTQEKDGYFAVQLGMGERKHTNKPMMGHIKKANLEKAPRFIKETRQDEDTVSQLELGSQVKVTDVVKPGDVIQITGTSKGKGFQGGMKRWGFHGGPASHGQSDRSRAPGSIGSGTTPGRVYKGKHMAGKMGNDQVTVKNLEVFAINEKDNVIEVVGAVPGSRDGFLILKVIGENKRHIGPAKVEQEEHEVEEKLEANVEEGAEKVFNAETKEADEETASEATSDNKEKAEESAKEEEAEDAKK